MKKLFKVGLFGVAAMLMLAGCSGKKNDTAKASQAEGTSAEESTEEYVKEGSITLGEYKGIPVTVPTPHVTEEEVDAQIQRSLEANAEYLETDKKAENEDMVNINFKGMVDGKAFDGGTAEAYDLVLGSGQFIEGFEDGLLGAKKGDKKDLKLKFPKDYQKKDLAGKDVVFEVTVNAVKVKTIPELNEEFVTKVSPEDGTVEKFRKSMEDAILNQKQLQINSQRDIDIVDAVIERSKIVCATADIDKEYEEQLQYHTNMAGMYGMDLASYAKLNGMDEDGLKKEIRNQAKEFAKQRMVLNEIAAKEKLTVTDEDREKLGQQSYYGSAEDLIKAVGQEKVDETALVQKTLNFLVENAVITAAESSDAPVSESETETVAE